MRDLRHWFRSLKLFLLDPGLASHLLGIESEPERAPSAFLGPLFEGFVASEIVKRQVNAGRRREIYYFRDQQGLEVDFVVNEHRPPVLREAAQRRPAGERTRAQAGRLPPSALAFAWFRVVPAKMARMSHGAQRTGAVLPVDGGRELF